MCGWSQMLSSLIHLLLVQCNSNKIVYLQVQATDLDDGVNAQLEYHLRSGNQNNTFQINRSSGDITTLNSVVDREGISLYHLVVEAVDQVYIHLVRTHSINIPVMKNCLLRLH